MIEHIQIEQIRPELTWRLRKDVLYQDKPLSLMAMQEDQDGLHFAAFYNNHIISVVSLFSHGTDYQLRKFAVLPNIQHKGVGKTMLQYITQVTVQQGGNRIWCNARLSAIGFYTKAGFLTTGQFFSKNGFDYEIIEKLLP